MDTKWSCRIICCVFLFAIVTTLSGEKALEFEGLDFLDIFNIMSEPPVTGVLKLFPRGRRLTSDFIASPVNIQEHREFFKDYIGTMTIHLSGKTEGNITATIFSIYRPHAKLPVLELTLDTNQRTIALRYIGSRSFQRINVQMESSLEEWTTLTIMVDHAFLRVKLDCQETKTINLRQEIETIPEDAVMVFLQNKDGDNKFKGVLFKADLYLSPVDNLVTMCSLDERFLQKDEMTGDTLAGCSEERVMLLEQQIAQLNMVVDMLQKENANLQSHVTYLETSCQCLPPCSHGDMVFEEGESWYTDDCTLCTCLSEQPVCAWRHDIPSCITPCIGSPCQNQGQCLETQTDIGIGYTCECRPPFDGSACEIRRNPCVWPIDTGTCDQNIPRYSYDRYSQNCLPFNYTGCGGNINNYPTMTACQEVAVTGACCFRSFGVSLDAVTASSQNGHSQCQMLSLDRCKLMHHHFEDQEQSEVIGFYPGLSCEEAGCAVPPSGCVIGETILHTGDSARVGCQECTCERRGYLNCRCTVKSVRKEIRDMTAEEIRRFHAAVRQLRLSGLENIWEQFRDLYMTHSMHSNGGPYYLPWHRYYLKQMEQKLQEIDCEITLPYFDFTTDVGNFSEAIIWQPNYFGGDGAGDCIPDHPFGQPGSWQPCIVRHFNTNIQLPTLAELALALSSDDFTEMSMCLETYAAYVHNFIGGDMATTGSPYDPVFYTIHAYIDMLYWWWQQKGNNKFRYPAAFGNIPMMPFNIPPSSILDNEGDLCVTYLLPSRGHPCNITMDIDAPYHRGDIPVISRRNGGGSGFDQFGYDADGYDRRGFDRYGYKHNGYNRDGFNRKGYDIYGFDRYGYNSNNFSRKGVDRTGHDWEGNLILMENTYDDQCLDREGFTKYGLDRYGFTVSGYDVDNCNYLFHGPFATLHSLRIWDILGAQDKGFLMTIPRICESLEPLPTDWLEQHWIRDTKDVTGLVPVWIPSMPVSPVSSKFCFEVQTFLIPCTCDTTLASCVENPCLTQSCRSYPEAICHVSFCDDCTATWYQNGMMVDCVEERDFCLPNPCENGGTCVSSVWINDRQLVTCLCPPGFDGHQCQHKTLNVCSLPINTGNCDKQESRWRFNYQTQQCDEFVYTGCGGNSNNFLSSAACQAHCQIGACCFRYPLFTDRITGYDYQGYDKYGFTVDGFNRLGERRTERNGVKSGIDRFGPDGYDWQGFDREGFDEEGYGRMGFDQKGFDREGFNITGYSRIGEYDGIIDYNDDGYDLEGFNRIGLNCHGYDRQGYNALALSAGFLYECRSMTLSMCQRVESKPGHMVIKFSPGKDCEDVGCVETCGCYYDNKTYKYGETFIVGCETCVCTQEGVVECQCVTQTRRKEIRDMNRNEMKRYQATIKTLAFTARFPSKWYHFTDLYQQHKPQAAGNNAFLPWHRYFLWYVEKELQQVDCSVTIPYYDWTIDVGAPFKSIIWSANMFGGNGHDILGCVRHHPFKLFHPPNWVPCLRRRFNDNVNLPDAIDVHLALRDPSYENFRLKMEVMLTLFQSWVGGHMASDLSPYDPIFFSVIAYIDRLWSEWQRRHPDGLLNYPLKDRFIPMAPFKVTPDDVMNSATLLCISYYTLTEGALCNITIPTYGFDRDGYDRHGYDGEGYDEDGYSILGLDRNGNIDKRGIYDIDGFDQEGYGRDGYDIMGFDRFGFYIDSFNLDGFNPYGYDRLGYDRYGFNQSGITPYGFHRNGTWLATRIPNLFDPYGYDRYGYNRYGFNRQGYDRFGFDSKGLDRQMCNNFFLGPMYVIVKHWTDLQLEKLDDKTIRIITRVCPAVTKLPPWRYTTNWLRRGDQIPLIETIDGRRLTLGPEGNVRDIENKIWLPTSPDQRLCFVTYYYTECQFGQFPVTCAVDLCENRQCPGYPEAVCRVNHCGSCSYEWYNGVTGESLQCTGCIDGDRLERGEGATWQRSECEICTCQQGMVSCSEVECPVVRCQYPVKLQGQCCQSCDAGCQYNDRIYGPETVFTPATSPCSDCTCSHGDVFCVHKVCISLESCHSSVTLEGECCPMCLDCDHHANGTRWKENPCQMCRCINGDATCEKITCPPLDCIHPDHPNGECCPVCVGCFFQGTIYQDGETFAPEDCTSCVCLQGSVECKVKDCPEVTCTNPIWPPDLCCPVCDSGCEYNSRFIEHNTNFSPTYDPCMNCSCVNSIVRCIPIHCEVVTRLPCSRAVPVHGECCPTRCPTCFYNGIEYSHGDSWISELETCKVCKCNEGLVSCRQRDTCALECTHGVVPRQSCCSPCKDCLYDGRLIKDEQMFIRPGDLCQQCTCTRGNIECHIVGPCPPLNCQVTEMQEGTCCPQCKGCEYHGDSYQNGDVVLSDSCTRCLCEEGQVVCDRVKCRTPTCRNPEEVEGQCCPVCRDCQYAGREHKEGERFTPERQPCLSCLCQNGEAVCENTESDCPAPTCTHPEKVPGKCCFQCKGCFFLRRRFRSGQKFVPPGGDACKVCVCIDGSIHCDQMNCPEVNCATPISLPGQCCPVCPMACNIMGKEYREGQSFTNPMDRCSVCSCNMGEITCRYMGCDPVPCSHPAVHPGECCPTCFMCLYENRTLHNLQVFAHPRDPCQECSCREGSISCSHVSCPPVTCANPQVGSDRCCGTCPALECEHDGVTYRDGQNFPMPRDPCQECICANGRVSCQHRSCPDVNCRNPTRGQCCPICQYCNYRGQIYRNSERFVSPLNKCEECQCRLGSVSCQRQSCPELPCSHPVYSPGQCCPQCTDCTYQRLLYQDGQRFQDPTNTCNTCVCSQGNVHCTNRECPQVKCRHPVTDGCCPKCTNCRYHNRFFPDGETFTSIQDPCLSCTCTAGTVDCQMKSCLPVTCEHPVQNRCCRECGDCFYQNRRFHDRQTFADISNACNECTCTTGSVVCHVRSCPPVTCSSPSQGKCCPECRDCIDGDVVIANGETFGRGPCDECVCRNGNIQCDRKQCPNVLCRNPVQRECCLECSACHYHGQEYASGAVFTNHENSCQQCSCTEGNVHCESKPCSSIQCNSPMQGECCPVCTDCYYRNRHYSNGDTFPDESDPCGTCTCRNGNIECVRDPCPPAVCSNPVQGRCCSECDSCYYHNRIYKDGDFYEDNCQDCVCLKGDIRCLPTYCAPISCTNPIKEGCCYICTDCMHEDKQIRNGEILPDLRDPCSECICKDGTFHCERKTCPTVRCDNPIQGECCLLCGDCEFDGQVIQNGHIFTDKNDPCRTCNCQSGTVQCERSECSPTNCNAPVTDSCRCSVCDDCRFLGTTFRNGKQFQHLSDPCQECYCQIMLQHTAQV